MFDTPLPPAFTHFLGRVGHTPMIELPAPKGCAKLLAKCEWMNPTGSIKDRAATAMVEDLLVCTNGPLSDLHLVEHSGGNLARSLSVLCAMLGIRNTLFLSAATPESFVRELEVNGSEARLVPGEEGFWGVMEAARRFAENNPETTYLNQHENYANLRIHETTTGQEILGFLQHSGLLKDKPEIALVSAIGTGGTLGGLTRALEAELGKVRTFGVTPAELPYGSALPPNGYPKFAGSGGLGDGRKQRFVGELGTKVEDHLTVTYDDSLSARNLLLEAVGISVGSSAAAAWLAAIEVGQRLGSSGLVITTLACQGLPEEQRRAEAPKYIAGAAHLRDRFFSDHAIPKP